MILFCGKRRLLSIEAKFGSLEGMEKASDKFKDFLEKLSPSSSSLFIGAEEEKAEEYLEIAAREMGISPIDVCRLVPESKTGKQKSILVESARKWIHDINITPRGKYKIGALLGAEKVNAESANTLLKTLEEPPRYAYMFIFSATDNMLPTIKSRCRTLHLWEAGEVSEIDQVFFSKSFGEQSKLIEKIVKDGEINQFLESLEKKAQNDMRKNPNVVQSALLKEIYIVKKRIKQNANARLQLENLFLKWRKSER